MIAQAMSLPRQRDGIGALILLVAVPAGLALMLTVFDLIHVLPTHLWWQALTAPDTSDPVQLLYRYAFLPRVAVSVLAGAALGLAGVVMQHVLRNPLAEPTTIGTNAEQASLWRPPPSTHHGCWKAAVKGWRWLAALSPHQPFSHWRAGAAFRQCRSSSPASSSASLSVRPARC